jgi:hypothetical protein
MPISAFVAIVQYTYPVRFWSSYASDHFTGLNENSGTLSAPFG